MHTEKLEIVRYSPGGKALRRIACLPGFISVFRSRSDVELGFYVDALHLRSAAGVSEIKINKAPATAEQLVYFGNSDALSPAEAQSWMMDIVSVGDGRGKSILKELSAETGLTVPPSQSTSSQDLIIFRILSLVSQNTRVVVLDDPFEGISTEILEPFAKAMVELVELSRAIVVVKKLSQRPEGWIENEHVERVQIEAPRQRTIGFGGHRVEFNTELLASAPRNPQLGLSSAMHPAIDPSQLPGFKPRREMLRVTLLSSVIIAIFVVAFLNREPSPGSSTRLNQSDLDSSYSSGNGSMSNRITADGSISRGDGNSGETEGVQLALASYPQDIQIAVTRAFNSPEEEIKQLPSFPPTPARVTKQSAPYSAPDTYASSNSDAEQSPAQTESDEELAERRARVRQSFLEALARARERLAAERAGQY